MLFRNKNKTLGNEAELQACNFLQRSKATVLERNFRSRHGEIDIIARENGTILFIEVKYRKSNSFGEPFESVTSEKQRKIIQTAQYYLQKNPRLSEFSCRFDVISVLGNEVEWIKDAFDLSS